LASIGIIANPASGKDIRRLVSFATVIDNNEKVNIVKRIVLAAQAFGIDTIYFMPDTYQAGRTVEATLKQQEILTAEIKIIDMYMDDSALDTTEAARQMEALGVGCIAVLGGDGTSRAAAKGIEHTPLIPLSTGTNNVYPRMIEGTVAGMAAAAVTCMDDPRSVCIHDKRIEIWVNDELVDIALIDAVMSDDTYAGAKAIWDVERIRMIVASRCHPAAIGFSAIAGAVRIVRDTDEGGFALRLSKDGRHVKAAIAAGVVEEVGIVDDRLLADNEMLEIPVPYTSMIALDGERELKVREGDRLSVRICRNGPWRVKPEEAIARLFGTT
jgi:predicted polyphosphate/ATP-dependent NAD kinase